MGNFSDGHISGIFEKEYALVRIGCCIVYVRVNQQ